MINKKIKKIFILFFILFFIVYIFLNIFYFSKDKNNFLLKKPEINLNVLNESICLEKPHYEKNYFIKNFINEFLKNLENQYFPENEKIKIDFYFNNNDIYIETNLIDSNYIYHYYLV
ncbi:MAG: hypothetical protein HPAVJP_4710 [Candidatus Hepatoplasma vulgare]|nr:MAG: hypothetical protein HPAVJP_4710 [Candidatus Hepatoplasma sp.]